MDMLTDKDIIEIVDRINQDNEPVLEEYMETFFTELIDINYFKDLKVTGEEQAKLEAAIEGIVKVSTFTSVKSTLEVLARLNVIKNVKID